MSFRAVRVALLSLVLVFVSLDAVLTHFRTTDWDRPLWVTIYPINGDQSVTAAKYIESLSDQEFNPIEEFMIREARKYGIDTRPAKLVLRSEVKTSPPEPPQSRNVFAVMWWSLKLRFWAWRNDDDNDGRPNDARMFVIYHDPDLEPALGHSLGLKKGLIGVVKLYAGRKYSALNNVVIAHELLHTVGATDKYDLSNNQPIYPDGYAEPDKRPRYPQRRAEIMAGRIPVSETEARPAGSLKNEIVGPLTAREINWLKD